MKKLIVLLIFIISHYHTLSSAMPFGVSDSRSLAMGGVGIATASSMNASFFNPAMLAQYSMRKEQATNSRFMFPSGSLRYSKTIEEIYDFKDADLDGQLSNSITNFNASVVAGNISEAQTRASPVANSSRQFQSGINEIIQGPFTLDFNSNLVIAIGGKGEGGALTIATRAVGDGVIVETAEDRLLMQKYIATMDYFAANGTIVGTPYPELFDGTGQLLNQTDNLTSFARGTLIVVSEFGMSFAHNVELFQQQFAIGFTPKTVRVTTYDIEANAAQQGISDRQELAHDWNLNLDLGIDKQINQVWRVGAVIKNLLPQSYETALNHEVNLKPQVRAGVAYTQRWGVLAADLDVLANDPIGPGDKSQVIGFGGEWRVWRMFNLLAGYQQNIKASGDQNKGLLSVGFVVQSRVVHFSTTYAQSAAERAAAITFAYLF